jgi:hypothetical protein
VYCLKSRSNTSWPLGWCPKVRKCLTTHHITQFMKAAINSEFSPYPVQSHSSTAYACSYIFYAALINTLRLAHNSTPFQVQHYAVMRLNVTQTMWQVIYCRSNTLANLQTYYCTKTKYSIRITSCHIQGGSNMTGTNCDLFTHKSSRSYLNHLVISVYTTTYLRPEEGGKLSLVDINSILCYMYLCTII